MTTEKNPIPAPVSRFQLSGDALAIIIAIVALGAAIIGILIMQVQGLSQQIQASDSDRQADNRAINARVDAAEQLVVATSPYRCPPIS